LLFFIAALAQQKKFIQH